MNEVRSNIEQNLPYLRRYAIALTRNPVTADDLVQECAARALAKADQYKPNTNLRAWLFTILHNLHVSEHRRRAKLQAVDLDENGSQLSVRPSQTVNIMVSDVGNALDTLPDEQSNILLMIGVEGKSYEEISNKLDLPIGTVKSRCFRAREALREKLDDKRPALLPNAA